MLALALFAVNLVASSAFAEGALSRDVLAIQRQFHATAFQSFIHDLNEKRPELLLSSTAVAEPAFDPALSRAQWVEQFVAAVIAAAPDKIGGDFRQKTLDMFTGYYHNEPFARVPFINIEKSGNGSAEILGTEPLPVLQNYPTPHTLDVDDYVEPRFPRALRNFLREHHAELFAHDGSCPDAIAYHRARGFSEVYRYHGRGDAEASPFILVHKPESDSYAFGMCEQPGKDNATRIAEILGPVFAGSHAFIVHHARKQPVFTLNSDGEKLQLTSKDRVIIGFANAFWWALANPDLGPSAADWERIVISADGADASVFHDKRTGERIVSIANVYGDQMREVLEILYNRGARRFFYMGTEGALDSSLNVGDVVVPAQFLETDGHWVTFENDATAMTFHLPVNAHYVGRTRQAWLASLIEESKPMLLSLQAKGAQGLEIEGKYFAEFFADHPALEKAMVLTVSDTPFGEHTYADESALRHLTDASIKAMVPDILKSKGVSK